MDSHFDLGDEEFEQQLEDCSLDPAIFDHEGHLRMAYIQISKYGVEYACDNMCRQIQDFDATYGTGRIFHTTLTCCCIRIVHSFMQRSKASSFKAFIYEHPIVRDDMKGLVSQYYSADLLAQEHARLHFIGPDRLSFI